MFCLGPKEKNHFWIFSFIPTVYLSASYLMHLFSFFSFFYSLPNSLNISPLSPHTALCVISLVCLEVAVRIFFPPLSLIRHCSSLLALVQRDCKDSQPQYYSLYRTVCKAVPFTCDAPNRPPSSGTMTRNDRHQGQW